MKVAVVILAISAFVLSAGLVAMWQATPSEPEVFFLQGYSVDHPEIRGQEWGPYTWATCQHRLEVYLTLIEENGSKGKLTADCFDIRKNGELSTDGRFPFDYGQER